MRGAFLYGDNIQQFFPWFKIYSSCLKNLELPFWTRYMQAGFPLAAEGQVGVFYPLNFIIFSLLPFELAYNYSVVIHFVIAGVSTYFYARRFKADQYGGYLAALLFCFGSAFAGCFYNMITLRTLAWFPLVLLLFERYIDRPKIRYIMIAAVIMGLQLLAGFMQMAVYSGFFYIVYFIYRLKIAKADMRRGLCHIGLFLGISALIALPQIILTYQLTGFTNRESASLDFALWGSFPPVGLFGLVFPYPTLFLKANFYVGILSLLFVIFSLLQIRQKKDMRPLVLILLLSLFLAIGRYNPLYTLALKATNLYIFRNPSKFLFFGAFAISVLAGCGLTDFFDISKLNQKSKAVGIFHWALISSGVMFLAAVALLNPLKDKIIGFGSWYVRNFVYNKPNHRYDIDYYLNKVNLIFENLQARLDMSNTFVIISWILVMVSLLSLPLILRRRLKRAVIFLIFIDIYVFSLYGIGFRGNIRPFSVLAADTPALLSVLEQDQEIYRIMPFDIESRRLPNWSIPNANIIYGIDSIASYSPLANERFRRGLPGLEITDDSLGLKPAAEESITANLDTIRLLNVKYIVSPERLRQHFLDELKQERGIYLYRLKGYMPRAFFTDSIDKAIEQDRSIPVEVLEYRDGLMSVEVTAAKDGFLIFSETPYPGWKVLVDGAEEPIIDIKGMVQAVRLEKGGHRVVFRFRPQFSIGRQRRSS